MDPKAAVETPQFLGPEISPGESHKQVFPQGEFSEDVLDALRAMGQGIKVGPKDDQLWSVGYWAGIKMDPETGKLEGGVARHFNGYAVGY